MPEPCVFKAGGDIIYRFAGPSTQEIMDNCIKPEIAKAANQEG